MVSGIPSQPNPQYQGRIYTPNRNKPAIWLPRYLSIYLSSFLAIYLSIYLAYSVLLLTRRIPTTAIGLKTPGPVPGFNNWQNVYITLFDITALFFVVFLLLFKFLENVPGAFRVIHSPFHKTLPRSCLQPHWISVRFYEMYFHIRPE